MVFKNLGSAVHNGQDCSSGYEFSENLLKNIAIQVKSSNFRKGKDWKAVMGVDFFEINVEKISNFR